MSIFEDWTGKSLILTKSLQASNPYEGTHASPPMSIFEDWADKSSILTKSHRRLAVDGNVVYH
jgi:hypothetical protein